MMNDVDLNQMQYYPPSISSSFEQTNDSFSNSSVFMYHRRKTAVSVNQNPSTDNFLAAIDGGSSSFGWQYNLLPQNTEVQIPWQCNNLPYDLNLPPICTGTSTDGISSLGPATPVRRREDEEIRVQIMDNVNGNCEVSRGNLLKLFEEVNPGLEVGGDLRKTPRQKERRKKHRPKVVKEAKKKAPTKNEGKQKVKVKESDDNNRTTTTTKPLRKYARRKGLNKELKGGEKKDCVYSCRRELNFEQDHHSNSGDFLTLSMSSSICESKCATPIVERTEEETTENVCCGLWFDFEKNGDKTHGTEERLFSESNDRREEISEESLARITRSRFNKTRRSVSISFPEGCKKRRTERCQSSIFGGGGGDGQGCVREERNESEYGEARSLVDCWNSSRDICFGQVSETFEAEKMVVFHTEMGPVALRVPKKKREKRRGRKERGFVDRRTSCIEALVSGMQTNVRKKKRSKKTGIPLLLPSEKKATQLKNVGVYFDYQHIPSYSNEHVFTYDLEADIELLSERLKNIDIFGYKKEQMMVPYIPGNGVSGAMVVYERDGRIVPVIRKRKPRAKVELDEETSRVWKLLMGNINDEGVDGDGEVKARWWEKERTTFSGRADSFIARMRLVQGDRRFSPWKGSVLDSVIGVFLTQNVSDHLSSSAFMSMAAHFPLKNKGEKGSKPPDETPVFFVEEPVEFPTIISHTPEEDYSPATTFFIEEKSRCTTPEPHIQLSGETTTSQSTDPEPGNSIQFDDPPISGSPEAGPDKSDTVSNKTVGTLYSLFLQEEPDYTSVLLDSSCLQKTDSRDEETKSEENGMEQSPGEDSTGKTVENPVDLPTNEGDITDENISHDDIRFCQSSGISSQHSDDSSAVLTSERVVQSPESTSESEEKVEVDLWDSKISFMDLLQLAETSTLDLRDSMQFADGIHHGGEYIDDSRPYTDITGYNSFRNSKEQHEGSEQSTGESASQVINEEYDRKVMENKEGGGSPSFIFESPNSVIHNRNVEKSISGSSGVVEKKEYGKKVGKEKESKYDWRRLRKEAEINGKKRERNESTMDSLDWEAVRRAEVREVAETIKERGMNNVLAGRIKDFLDRLVREQGSIDLEWLRDVEPDKAKEYLLSIRGLGLKSVECVRLLTLHHLAFPVDTNVGRIVVRLGWVPLQPLPESLQLHLLELYPMLETIQKYLWPRLCKLDQKTLYELHYQMITFGKVFCTKNKPNCNSCPMRGECRHFASAFTSARLALPGPEEKGIVSVRGNTEMVEMGGVIPLMLPSIEVGTKSSSASVCEPIIEEPPSPEPVHKMESDIEDLLCGEEDEIPTIKLNIEEFSLNLQTYIQNNMELEGVEMSKALVALTPEAASIPMPKMKNVSRLRTEHQVYELPDSHPLLEGMDRREPDDPCSYLLAIWTPGETANSIEPPERKSESCEFGQLCSEETCSLCGSRREAESQTVRGTLLIPCRTAMRGSFPLNGTYFQVNEVFADHDSSINPIDVPRSWIWNLHRRTVYFGSSIPTIFRGLTTEGIQHCFWRGYVCVRGFDQKTRAPRPLMARLHLPASKLNKRKDNGAPNRSEANPVVPKVSISLENAVSGEPTQQQQRLQLVL